MVDEPSTDSTHRSLSDWPSDAHDVLAEIDDRAQAILVERLFALDGRFPTLQDLGDRFDLSRERVRQIESKTKKKLLLRAETSRGVSSAISAVRDRLGLAFSVDELANTLDVEIDPARVPIEVLLVLFLAGPYRMSGRTLVSTRFDAALTQALTPIAEGPVDLSQVRAAMRRIGIRDDHQLDALRGRRNIRVLGDLVVPWSGSMADKAAVILSMHQRLMTPEEIHSALGEGSLTTLKNYLGSDARFRRRGPHTWGLTEWGGEKYKTIATEMADELLDLPDGMPVERLKRLLDEKFGIRGSSVEIMSATHPMFIREGAWVRLRNDDEPYVPDSALEEDSDCVVINHSWAWRHRVTHDTLRGSGHMIPEPFAAFLRVVPGSRIEFATDDAGVIPLYWSSQSPGIGSLRRVAEACGAAEGDYVFVIPRNGRLDFELVTRSSLNSAELPQNLLLRLGQGGGVNSWLPACASAIGLPHHAQADEVEELLEVRGDREVLRLFRAARRIEEP